MATHGDERGQNVQERILRERERQQAVTVGDLVFKILEGNYRSATGNLLFHTSASAFGRKSEDLLRRCGETFSSEDAAARESILRFLIHYGISLRSFLAEWVLAKELDERSLTDETLRVIDLLDRLEKETGNGPKGGPVDAVRGTIRKELDGRLQAEGLEGTGRDEERERLLGSSLADYVRNVTDRVRRSNFYIVSKAMLDGKTISRVGNDYAAFGEYVLWVGGSFVTTNPVLIKMAWDIDPAYWDERIDAIIGDLYGKDDLDRILAAGGRETDEAVSAINTRITVSVVEENCRMLRDIFLITGGKDGYVSLQVNPANHSDSEPMIREARLVYRELETRLGGVPNVVIKVPATSAGLEAARALGADGIGVTVTVNFSLFQAKGFAEVIRSSRAPISYMAMMNGRLAFPVRDELVANAVPGGKKASELAGVEVARKIQRIYYGDNAGAGSLLPEKEKLRLMIASLRIYDGEIPDISDMWGVPLITVFPNVRRAYDDRERPFDGRAIDGETPGETLDVLAKSEIFRQAWWLPGDPERFKPSRPLTLEERDAEAVAVWPPVGQTLNQFIDLYRQMGGMVKARMSRAVRRTGA